MITLPMPFGEAEQTTTTRKAVQCHRAAGHTGLILIVHMSDRNKVVVAIPDHRRESMEALEPRLKGHDLALITEAIAVKLKVF